MKKTDLHDLRKKLPLKWSDTISERTGHPVSTVRNVIYGERAVNFKNQDIIDAAIALAMEVKNSQGNRVKQIRKL